MAGRHSRRRAAGRGHLEIGRGRDSRLDYHRARLEARRSARRLRSSESAHLKPSSKIAAAAQDRVRRESRALLDLEPRHRRRAASTTTSCSTPSCSTPTPPAVRSTSRPSRRLDLKLGAAPEQHADIILELSERLRPAVERAACASCTQRSNCPWPACWRAWNAPACASIAAELARLSAMMETRDRAPHRARSTARRPRLQHQLAAAARRDPLRGSEPARAREIRQRQRPSPPPPIFWNARARTRDRPPSARIPPAHQAQRHLRRRAARPDRSRAPAAFTPASIRPEPPPAACPPRIRICRTFRSAPHSAARSAPLSFRAKAGN